MQDFYYKSTLVSWEYFNCHYVEYLLSFPMIVNEMFKKNQSKRQIFSRSLMLIAISIQNFEESNTGQWLTGQICNQTAQVPISVCAFLHCLTYGESQTSFFICKMGVIVIVPISCDCCNSERVKICNNIQNNALPHGLCCIPFVN